MVDLDHSTETWGLAVFGSLAALVATALPVVALVRLAPALKEALIGAAVVYLLLETTEPNDGAVFAVVAGMAATLAFNAVRIVAESLLGVGLVGGGADVAAAVGAPPQVAAALRLAGLIAVLVASPVGYAVGGAVGAWLNGRDDEDEADEGGRERTDDETPAGDAEWEPTR